MQLKHSKTLITGLPGIGKTTLIKRILAELDPKSTAGFYTSEIRKRGLRNGFELDSLTGERRILAHVNISSRFRVGKYNVDVSGFDDFLERLDLLNCGAEIVVIDEIGKMEILSRRFQSIVRHILSSDQKVLGTIALKGKGFIRQVKQMPKVKVIEATSANRDRLVSEILD